MFHDVWYLWVSSCTAYLYNTVYLIVGTECKNSENEEKEKAISKWHVYTNVIEI